MAAAQPEYVFQQGLRSDRVVLTNRILFDIWHVNGNDRRCSLYVEKKCHARLHCRNGVYSLAPDTHHNHAPQEQTIIEMDMVGWATEQAVKTFTAISEIIRMAFERY